MSMPEESYKSHLVYTVSVRGGPHVELIVLAGRDKPITSRGELQGQDTGLVFLELVLLRDGCVDVK